METTDFNDELMQQKPRPAFLTVLCVLSFISTGIGLISGLFNFVMGPSSEEAMLNTKVEMARSVGEMRDSGLNSLADMLEKIQWMTEDINHNFYLASTISLVVVALGLFSVLKMFKGFRLGFHMYIAYNLIGIVAMYIYVSPAHIPTLMVVFNLIFSGLFIFLYSRNLHWMNK